MRPLVAAFVAMGVLLTSTLSPVLAQQAVKRPLGLLVGFHGPSSYAAATADLSRPFAYRYRTLFIQLGSDAPASVTEVGDLLLPRRSGFWRIGASETCVESESDVVDADGRSRGVEALHSELLWEGPSTRMPVVQAIREWPDQRIGPCVAPVIFCSVEESIRVEWAFPELGILARTGDYGCGAHPDAYVSLRARGWGERRLRTVSEVFGAQIERRLREAYARERAVKDAQGSGAGCFSDTTFHPTEWTLEREKGGWKARGLSETHRLCGYYIDFTVDVTLPRSLGHGDDRALFDTLRARLPLMTDIHSAPIPGWALAVADGSVRVINTAAPSEAAAVSVKSNLDDVVMVEWVTGDNVARWRAEVDRLKQAPPVAPRFQSCLGECRD